MGTVVSAEVREGWVDSGAWPLEVVSADGPVEQASQLHTIVFIPD